MTPDQPLPRWNPILRWSFGSCSHQCTALRRPVPKLGPSLMTGTCWRSSATSTDRRSWCDVLFCEPNENAAALALVPPVPPRRSHTCTIPRPDPAMTVWPSSLARAQLNGEWRSVGAVSSARGKPPAHRSSQRYTRPRRPAASTRLPSPGQNRTSSRPAPCPSPVLPNALPAFSASKRPSGHPAGVQVHDLNRHPVPRRRRHSVPATSPRHRRQRSVDRRVTQRAPPLEPGLVQ